MRVEGETQVATIGRPASTPRAIVKELDIGADNLWSHVDFQSEPIAKLLRKLRCGTQEVTTTAERLTPRA